MPDSPPPDYALIDRSGIGRGIFYPRPDFSRPPIGALDYHVDVEPGVAIAARLYAAATDLATLLYFHGNGEVVSDYDAVAPIYHQFGLNLCVADYRGYGASGGVPSFSSLISDAYPVLDWFHDVLDGGAFTGPRFVMGRSLGAHPALEIAARRPERLSGVIIESGAGNLRRLLRYVGGDQADHAATELVERHARKIGSIQLPMLVIHGAEDELIPVEHVIDLHDSLRTTEKEILIIPGAGHNDIMWVGLRQYFEALATSFVGRHS